MDNMTFSQFISTYNTLFKEGDSLYHSLARHFNLSDSAFWILYILKEYGTPITQAELCSALCLSKQTINSALKSLFDAGYISLDVCPEKKRSKSLFLTPLGHEFTQRTIGRVFQMEEQAFNRLSQTQRHELLSQAAQPILENNTQEDFDSNGNQTI